MGGFTPEMLPVFSTLARSFAVFDHWHAAVPSQTFCNRCFFHASTSHGFVTNKDSGGAQKWLNAPAVPTIFNRLEEAGLSWRVYYDAEQVVSLTGMLHAPSLERYWKTNFRSMEQFRDDAANGNLPVYSFIEPRLIFDHNDMHPPANIPKGGKRGFETAFSDVRAAEALLADVYTTVRNGSSTTGSNAINTALLVTFDEHGGLFDHVPPPSAPPPSGRLEPGEMGFAFDRLGVRVPTILVSAYVEEGTIESEPTQHASVASTLARQHGLKPLTERDRHARPLQETIRRKAPRQPQLWPDVRAPYVPPNPEARRAEPAGRDRERPLTAPAKGLLGLLLAKYEPGTREPETFGDAYDLLHRHGELLFGTTDRASTDGASTD
jgi:phospholipase C